MQHFAHPASGSQSEAPAHATAPAGGPAPIPEQPASTVEGHAIDPTPPSSSTDVPVATPRMRSSRLASKPPVNYNETQLQQASLARARQEQLATAPKPRARRASLTGSEPDLGRGQDEGSSLALPMQANSDSEPGLASIRQSLCYSSDDELEVFTGILREDLESDPVDLADPFGLNDPMQFPPLALPAKKASVGAEKAPAEPKAELSSADLFVDPDREQKMLDLADREAERYHQAYAEVNQHSLSAIPPLLTAIAEVHEEPAAQPAAVADESLSSAQADVALPMAEKPPAEGHRLHIDAALDPYITHEAMSRFVDGKYRPATDESELHDSFFSRRGTVFSLAQPKDVPAACMRLFNPATNTVLTPSLVLADTGADLTICISSSIATTMGLTWTDNTTLLRGIGGSGGTLGRTNERVKILLGGTDDVEDVGTTPFQGCFAMYAHAIVLSPALVKSIGHRVILGASFLRNCLATFDPVTETMEYAPAFMSHQCLDLRCRVPCQMSEPHAHLAAPIFMADGFKDTDTLRDFLGESPAPAVKSADPAKPEATEQRQSTSASAKRRRRSRKKKTAGVLAMPLAMPATPGFPQADAPPSRVQYKAAKAEQAQRNREHAAEAAARVLSAPFPSVLRQPQPLAPAVNGRIRPLGVVYGIDELRRSGRLLPSLELDLDSESTTKTLMTQIRQLEERIRTLEAGATGGASSPVTAPPALPPVPARSAPLQTLRGLRVEPVPALPNSAPAKPVEGSGQSVTPPPAPEPEAVEQPAVGSKAPKAPVTKTPRTHAMRTRAQVDSVHEAPQPPVQHEVVNLAVIKTAPGEPILKGRHPYRVPPSWLARRCGVPLATALAFMPTVASASDGQPAVGTHVHIVASFLIAITTVFFFSRASRRSLFQLWQRLADLVVSAIR